MKSPIKYLKIIQYFRNTLPSTTETIISPTWNQVELAIRQMDNYCFPIVQLGCGHPNGDDDSFNLIGGNGRLAIFHFMADWQYDDKSGDMAETRLWESDQGYFCHECNVIKDIELALRIAKKYFESGSYDGLDAEPPIASFLKSMLIGGGPVNATVPAVQYFTCKLNGTAPPPACPVGSKVWLARRRAA